MPYEVIDSPFNRANYPDMIGQVLAEPPAYAQVKLTLRYAKDELDLKQKLLAIHSNLWDDLPENQRQFGTGHTLGELTNAVAFAANCDVRGTIQALLRFDRAVNHLVPLVPSDSQVAVQRLYDDALTIGMDGVLEALGKNCQTHLAVGS